MDSSASDFLQLEFHGLPLPALLFGVGFMMLTLWWLGLLPRLPGSKRSFRPRPRDRR